MKRQSIFLLSISIVLAVFIITGCADDKSYLTETKKIYSFDNSTLIITENGLLYAVGNNSKGQLGLGDNISRNIPEKVNIPNKVKNVLVSQIVDDNNTINYSIYAFLLDGSTYAWGYNPNGRLGVGNYTENVNIPTKLALTSGVKELVVGSKATFAIMNDGSLYSWGDNTDFQLGVGDNYSRNMPTKVMITGDVTKVITDESSTYAVMSNGLLYTWGTNNFGQLGTGIFDKRVIPGKLLLSGSVKDITVRAYSVYVLTTDGYLYTWGQNALGQLGQGTNEITLPTPYKMPLSGTIKDLIIDELSIYALMTDGSLYTWGQNTFGQLGTGDFENKNAPVKVNITGVKDLKINGNSVYAVTIDGSLYTWGYNTYGQLGLGDFEDKSTPSKVALPAGFKNFLKLDYAVLAELSDNSIYAWGMNNYGQLGNGDFENKSLPVKLTLPGKINKYIDTVSTSYVILEDNSLYAWGENNYGQLGIGDYESKNLPVKVKINGIINNISISQDYDSYSIYAFMSDGSLYSWGSNRKGKLGTGNNYSTGSIPTKVNVFGYAKSILSDTLNSIYLLMADGSLYSWGDNTFGKLGTGSNDEKISYPVEMNF